MKEEIINKIIKAMEAEGEYIYNNKDMKPEDKLIQADVLIDVIKFLKDYDRNTKILNQNISKTDPSWDEVSK